MSSKFSDDFDSRSKIAKAKDCIVRISQQLAMHIMHRAEAHLTLIECWDLGAGIENVRLSLSHQILQLWKVLVAVITFGGDSS